MLSEKQTHTQVVGPVHRTTGVTESERYLHRLCNRSFLSLWSYPGVYRDQGRPDGGHGKEVCDLLVVFENHILIFSDKDCGFPQHVDLGVAWCRWFRKAVLDSAGQVWGAERWIRSHRDRLFLDRACTKRFPLDLPDPAKAKIHRIVVAHGVCQRIRQQFGASGSLLLSSNTIGRAHYADPKTVSPFVLGDIDRTRGFVHVFDDTGLDVVMRELDTAPDFVRYLSGARRLSAEIAWPARRARKICWGVIY